MSSLQFLRGNLASAIWPFYIDAAGRTIIVPGNDENFDRYNAANTVPDKGVPQVLYMHNTMPISGGFQSIGYTKIISPLAGVSDFDEAFTIRTTDLANFILVPANGKNYLYSGNTNQWNSISPVPAGSVKQGVIVTKAFVQGQTYFCYANYGTFYYDDIANAMVQVVWVGGALDDTQVKGICAANGYLIAYTDTAVAWSSLTNPLDFQPSIDTGAGGGNIQDAKGAINFCLSITGGFLIYCDQNVVGASYSNNASFPYIFLEVPDSGGCDDPDRVAWQSNLDTHLAYTTSGVQLFNKSQATGIMPEVADFLAAQIYEDFDETTNTFTQTDLDVPLSVKMSAVSDRYLIISYGQQPGAFTFALVMDTVLNRWGKLRITHVSCFDYNNPSPFGALTYAQLMTTTLQSLLPNTTYQDLFTTQQVQSLPKKTLAFLQADGTVLTVDFDLTMENSSGVFIIGKYQHIRNNVIVHQRTDIESIKTSSTFSLMLLPTFDGKDFAAAVPLLTTVTGAKTRTFAGKFTASNLSLLCKGAYNLTSLTIYYTIGGSR